MGVMLLVSALVVEAGLAGYSLRTRSRQTRVRAVVRLVWCAGVALLLALPVTDWGPRYYAVAGFALVVAARGVVVLAAGAASRGPAASVRPGRVVASAAGMSALVVIATLPAVLFPQTRPLEVTGADPVERATRTYTDLERVDGFGHRPEPRRLTVELWYPEVADGATGPGSHPLIVYSHGGAGIRTANESLCAELASHGYLVAAVDHTHQSLFTTDVEGRTTWIDRSYWRELSTEDARSDPERSYRLYQEWLQLRIADLEFVIDLLLAEAATGGGGQPDGGPIGVMGHSLGGSAALGLARERADVGAVVALEAPLLWDIEGAEGDVFVWNADPYPVPALHLYSDSAWDHLADWPQYAANHAALTGRGGTITSVHLAGVGHFGLTDLARTSPILTRLLDGQRPATDAGDVLRAINDHTRTFFDAHLPPDPDGPDGPVTP